MTAMTEAEKIRLKEIFNKFVVKAVADFPQLEKKLVLFSAPTSTAHGSFASMDMVLAESKKLQLQVYHYQTNDSKTPDAFALRDGDHYLMAYLGSITPDQSDPDIERVLEHELGHLMVTSGWKPEDTHTSVFHECAADAFATLRMQQAIPSDKTTEEKVYWSRCMELVFQGRDSHFTVPVLQELDDCSKIPSAQIANIAYRAAFQYTPSQEQLDRWVKIFAPVRQIYDGTIQQLLLALEKCIEIMFADHGENSKMIFTIGRTIIEPFLNNRQDILMSIIRPEILAGFKIEGGEAVCTAIAARAEQMKETQQQILTHQLDHMQVMGCFDSEPDKPIDPVQYESSENLARIKLAREAYAAKQVKVFKP